MAVLDLTDLRNQINNDIKQNGVRAITGDLMNTQLIDMIDSIESDYDTITGDLDTRVTDIESAALLILQDKETGWDASVGTFPGGGTAKAGFYWNVAVAGIVDGVSFDVGDSLLAVADNASTTTYDGFWNKKDDIDPVISVAGKVGTIILVAADITDFDAEVSNNTDVAANTAKVSNVTTDLSEGVTSNTTVEIISSDGTNAVLNEASTTRAGVLSKAKWDEIVANTAKVTNANHSGDMSGDSILTANPALISGKATLGSLSGTEEFLINDGGVLKKVLASSLGGADGNGIYDGSGSLSGATTVNQLSNDLTFTTANCRTIYNAVGTKGGLRFINNGTILFANANDAANVSIMLDADGTGRPPFISWGNAGNTFLAILGRVHSAGNIITGSAVGDFGYRTDGNHLFGNNAGTERMRLTATGNLGIGTTPTAKLQVKGINQLGTSTALLVQNGAGTPADLLKVANDGSTTINGQTRISNSSGTGRLHVKGSTGGDTLVVNTDSSSTSVDAINVVQNDALTSVFKMNAQGASYWQGTLAKLHVGASGTTAVGTAMVNIKGSTNTSGGRNLYIAKNNGDPLLYSYDNGTFALAQSGIDFNCRLQVQGTNQLGTSTALLVQNSASTDLFKVANDGTATLNGTLNGLKIETVSGDQYLSHSSQSASGNEHGLNLRAAQTRLNVKTGGFLALDINNIPKLFIASTGNIGIGNSITAPTALLQVAGTFHADGALKFSNGATDGYSLVSDASGNATWQDRRAKGVTNRVQITNGSGDLVDGGLVLETISGEQYLSNEANTASGNGHGLNLRAAQTRLNVKTGGFLALDINNVPQVFINSSGNVGVGNNFLTPTAKLHVNGSTLLDGNLGVFGTTPIAQPTTAIIAPSPVAVGGVNVQTNDTYEGYTMSQVVKALRNLGILA